MVQEQCYRLDKLELKNLKFKRDINTGYLKGSAIVTGVGVYTYQIGSGNTIKELRKTEYVFDKNSLETMKSIPVTENHPEDGYVDSKNSHKYMVGYTASDEPSIVDKKYVALNFVVTNEDTIKKIESGTKVSISMGYTQVPLQEKGYFENERYDCIQTNIKYNHLAIVDYGKAGLIARINLDSADFGAVKNIGIDQKLIKKTNKKKGITMLEAEEACENSTDNQIELLQANLKKEESEKKLLSKKIEDLQKEKKQILKSHEELVKELETEKEKMSKENIDRMVKNRCDVMASAKDILMYDDRLVHSYDTKELMFAVVHKLNPEFVQTYNCDSVSNDTLLGLYTALVAKYYENKGQCRNDSIANLISGRGGFASNRSNEDNGVSLLNLNAIKR